MRSGRQDPTFAPMLPIAIIEDQPELRTALADYLCQQPEFRCVLVVGSVEEFLAGAGSAHPTPQLILSDIGLPGRSGIEGLPLIRQRLPSVFNDAERVVEALRAGAVGYLEKDTLPAQVKEALLQVAAGGSPMSPGVARHVVRFFQPAPTEQPREALTPREQEVVRAIEDGLSYKLVAKRLFISVDTVRAHIRSVYRKLEVNSKADILRRAGRQGPA
jgi:DNA-binding NarL/FixJ family response regulator